MSIGPIKNVVNVKLFGLLGSFTAYCALVAVASLYEFANCTPPFASVTFASAFPMWGFVASHSIGGVVLAGSLFEAGQCFIANFVTWV